MGEAGRRDIAHQRRVGLRCVRGERGGHPESPEKSDEESDEESDNEFLRGGEAEDGMEES